MIKDMRISADKISSFSEMIPDTFLTHIKSGDLFGIISFNDDNDAPVGITILGERNGWAEIAWFGMMKNYNSAGYMADMLKKKIMYVEAAGQLKGIFTEIPVPEEKEEAMKLKTALYISGFEVVEAEGNVLSFALKDVNTDLITHNEKADCPCIDNISTLQKNKLVKLAVSGDKTVPVDNHIKWNEYDGQLSVADLKDDEPTGMLLVKRKEDLVEISLAVETGGPKALARMLGSLYNNIRSQMPENTEIVVPVVNPVAAGIVKKMASKYTTDRIYNGVYRF